MKRSTLYTIAAVLAVGLLFFYMTTARATEECAVCIEFQGGTNCATAAGRTAREATEAAQNTACGPLARGMNETIACGNRAPVSVQCKPR
jgi:threonine/homoserine efflux transporter RhtA